MKRLKVAALILGLTVLLGGCTPPENQGERLDEVQNVTAEPAESVAGDAAESAKDNSESSVNGSETDQSQGDADAAKSDEADRDISSENTEGPESAENTGNDKITGDMKKADNGEGTDKDDAVNENQASNEDAVTDNNDSTESDAEDIEEAGEIQKEMAEIEAKSKEIEKKTWDDRPQQEMNQLTGEWYELWDKELNSLWSRLIEKVSPEEKEELLQDQRAWIKRKEASVKAAGEEALGGSLQPQLENGAGVRYTRKRSYYLATLLAEKMGEGFKIPDEVQESIIDVDPDLGRVFERFEGQWIFDIDRGACIGIGRSEEVDYAPEGSTWTVWVTGGDIISDLDVINYTDESITFYRKGDSFDSYYILSFNLEGGVEMAYGHSLDKMDDVIMSY